VTLSGDEMGMLEDMSIAIRDLSAVKFKVCLADYGKYKKKIIKYKNQNFRFIINVEILKRVALNIFTLNE
jgi:hypothetical protein